MPYRLRLAPSLVALGAIGCSSGRLDLDTPTPPGFGVTDASSPTVGAASVALVAQSAPDPDINRRIREEVAARSQVMRTLHVLTDLYGPRLTGSPNAKAAAEWTVKTMTAWGFANGHLEPWDFGRPGWANERVSAHIVQPVRDALTVEVLAWSPGTAGVVRAPAIALAIPDRPTESQLTEYLNSVA